MADSTTAGGTVAAPTWRRLVRLRPIDAGQLAVLTLVMASIEPSLRMRGVERTASMVRVRFLDDEQQTSGVAGTVGLDVRERRWVFNAMRIVRRWPFDRSCLRRSLLLGWVLRARNPLLIIGTRLGGDGIEAHAWIRIGSIDLEPDASSYTVFGDVG